MIWVIVALGCALVFALGWISYRKPAPINLTAGDKTVVATFDEKKKAEAARIDGETHASLLSDLNRRD